MNNWQRWLQAPHSHWLRKCLFQIHLWTGICLSLYVLTISVTGSAILLQPFVIRYFVPSQLEPTNEVAFAGQELETKIEEEYEGFIVYFTVPSYSPDKATYVVLHKDEIVYPRYFNQYTGRDLGPSNPWQVLTFEWLVDVHDDLLVGRLGRKINGIGGLGFLFMFASGAIIWWQGRLKWKEGLQIKKASPRGINWQLHSFIGFWTLFFMFAWGFTGFYLGFPQPVNVVINWFDKDLLDFERPDSWLRILMDIHFARIGSGDLARWLWSIIGLLPSVMVISGFIIWWKRVVIKLIKKGV